MYKSCIIKYIFAVKAHLATALKTYIHTHTKVHLQTHTNFTEASSVNVDSHSAGVEVPQLLRNPKIYYHEHRVPQLCFFLSYTNRVHPSINYLFEINLNTMLPFTPIYPSSVVVPSDFANKVLYYFIFIVA